MFICLSPGQMEGLISIDLMLKNSSSSSVLFTANSMTQAMLTRIHKSLLSPNFIFAAWRDAGQSGHRLCFANYAYQSVSTRAGGTLAPRPIRVSASDHWPTRECLEENPSMKISLSAWHELGGAGALSQCLVHHQGVLLKSKSKATILHLENE